MPEKPAPVKSPRAPRGTIVFALIVVLVCVALAGTGFVVGRATVLLPLRSNIDIFRKGTTLGMLKQGEWRDAAARNYFDSEAARANMDSYAWTVPNVMAPFVGHAPEPGRSDNAKINFWQSRVPPRQGEDGRDRPAVRLDLPKPDGVARIFMTGASVLFCSGAPGQDRTIASYLERQLNDELSATTGVRYEVYPVANPAWVSTHERVMIENRITELEPDLVVSLSGTSDIEWAFQGHDVLWMQSLMEKAFFDTLNGVLELLGYEPMMKVAVKRPHSIEIDRVVDRLEKNVRLSTHVLSWAKVPYVFAFQPAIHVTKKTLSEGEEAHVRQMRELAPAVYSAHEQYYRECSKPMRDRIRGLALGGLHFVDLMPVFDDLGAGDDIFVDAFHFGDRGNKILAGAIFAAIRPLLSP